MDQNRVVVELFMNQIIECKWDESLTTLHRIESIDEKTTELASMAILKHKLSQLLKEGKSTEALDTLKNQIAPLCKNDEVLFHEFCLSFATPATNVVNGPHSYGEKALEDLRNILPTEMILERRLVDHRVGRENIPSRCLQTLRACLDEVWFLQFSHNGKYLASSSKDYRVVMWEVNMATYEVSLMRVLRGHRKPVSYITWSSDDSQLLTCGAEESVRRWNIPLGENLREYSIWGLGTVSCAWRPQGNQILTGLIDNSIIIWSLDGEVIQRLTGQQYTMRLADLLVTGGGLVITTFKENTIVLFDEYVKRLIREDGDILSFSLSEDGNFLLVSMSNEELHLWDIGTENPVIVMKLEGHKCQRCVVRACFGGQAYIASGSDDSQVYIWDRVSGEMIRKLAGHSEVVNCVCSNPAIPRMLASGSDDRTIRIWG